MSDLLHTSVSGLLAFQRALATTGQNISNVNTPGYSRQSVQLSARNPQFFGFGFVGKGVDVASVERSYDAFVTAQLRSNTSASSQYATFLAMSGRIDNMLADSNAGLSPALQGFFSAVQDVADDPSSVPAREALLAEAGALSARFRFLDQRLADLTREYKGRLQDETNEITELGRAIARVNQDIVLQTGRAGGSQPNDLLDQRDELIRQLAERVAVTTVPQSDGALNVFIGNGQALTVGAQSFTLGVAEPYVGRYTISYSSGVGTVDITQSVSGGAIGGLLEFNANVLEPARNGLGRIATGLAEVFNQQHRLGQTLDGAVGVDFFDVGGVAVQPSAGAPNVVSAAITDVSELTTSDYELLYNGGTSYTLTRLSDNQTFPIDTFGASPFAAAPVDGFALTITAGATAGDRFLVQPTRFGARDIGVSIADGRRIAAASPLRGVEATDASGTPTNAGSGRIGAVRNTSTNLLPLGAPITLTFNAASNLFLLSAPPGGALSYNPATDSAGKEFTITGYGNATFTISGVPADGDSFVIENNTGAAGDNRNALLLGDLAGQATLVGGGTATFQETYGQLVASVGSQTRAADINNSALRALLDQSIAERESISGVNLDEEAANLVRYQEAYQASAQMISIADSLFQTLIGAIGR